MKERKKERMEERMEGSKGEQILETVGNRQGRKGEGGRGGGGVILIGRRTDLK